MEMTYTDHARLSQIDRMFEEARQERHDDYVAEAQRDSSVKLNICDAVMICEGVDDADEETAIAAWQLLIDTGTCWSLQGWFGRAAHSLIEQGICHPATK